MNIPHRAKRATLSLAMTSTALNSRQSRFIDIEMSNKEQRSAFEEDEGIKFKS